MLSVLKLPIIRECECECEGRGKKGTPAPPEFVEKVGTRANKGNEGGERGKVSPFPFPLPQTLLHLFLAVAPTFAQYYEKNSIKNAGYAGHSQSYC